MLVIFFKALFAMFYNDLCCFFQSVSCNMPLEAPETQPNEANEVTACNVLNMGLQIIFMHSE